MEYFVSLFDLILAYTEVTGIFMIIILFLITRFKLWEKPLKLMAIAYVFQILAFAFQYDSFSYESLPLMAEVLVFALGFFAFFFGLLFVIYTRLLNRQTAILSLILLLALSVLFLLTDGQGRFIVFVIMTLFYITLNYFALRKYFVPKKGEANWIMLMISLIFIGLAIIFGTRAFLLTRHIRDYATYEIFVLLHYLFMGWYLINSPRWFESEQRKVNRSFFYGYLFIMLLGFVFYYFGSWGWSSLLAETVSLIFTRYVTGSEAFVILNAPLLVAFSVSGMGLVVYAVLMRVIYRTQSKNRKINELLKFNRKIFRQSPAPILIVHRRFITDANPAAEALFMRDRENLMKSRFDEMIITGDWMEYLQSSGKKMTELYILDGNGKRKRCRMEKAVIEMGGEKFSLIFVTDLTRVHNELRNLKMTNEIYQNLLSNIPFSERLRESYYLLRIYFHPEKASLVFKEGQTRIKTGEPCEHSEEGSLFFQMGKGPDHSGYLCFTFNQGSLSLSDEESLRLLVSIINDALERELLTKRLAESESTYRALVENSLTGIFIYQNQKIVYANRRFCLFFDLKPSMLEKKHPANFAFHEKSREAWINNLNAEISGEKESSILSFENKKERGKGRWFTVYESGISYHGQPAVLGHILEISAEVEALKQREKLTDLMIKEQKMSTLQNLVRGVAHEFNNIFAIIKGYVDLLMYRVKDYPDIENDILAIREASIRGADITNRMHIFARHEKQEIRPIDLARFFESSLSFFQSVIRKQKKEIGFNYEMKSENITVMADEFSLEEIFQNLFLNSIDAIKKKGEIRIICEKEEDRANILFIDNGEGMNEENLEMVFDPFFTTKEPNQGPGLGLYIVYELVRGMNGHVSLESRKSEGTTVKISLPLVIS